MSFPFRPAFMKASPVHRIIAYEEVNARPLKASDAKTGAPSVFQVLTSTLKDAPEQADSVNVSVLLKAPGITSAVT